MALEKGGWTKYSPEAYPPAPLPEAAPNSLTGLVHSSCQLVALGGSSPRKQQEARGHSNKTLKEAIISGLPIPARVPAARFPELLSLPLAVGKIKLN